MAFTTNANHSQTATDIITEAMEIIGILEEGESPSTAATTSALRSLNNIIKMWSVDYIIYAQGEYTLDLAADDADYALGVSNVGYIPQKVLNATLINTSTNDEQPINELTQEEWYALSNKTTGGPPTQFYQKRNAVGVDLDLYVWPVPENTTYDLKLWLQYPLRDVDAGTDDVYFTQEWYLALTFGLAHILGWKYGIQPSERDRLEGLADKYREEASSYDVDGSVFLQPQSKHG